MGVLLCLAIIGAVIATIATVQAFQRFQQRHQLVVTGDVRTIEPWMTIRHISIVYHVPENYLYDSLNISRSHNEKLSLMLLADRYKRPVNELIHQVQAAILIYREKHLSSGLPPPPLTYYTTRLPTAGRENG